MTATSLPAGGAAPLSLSLSELVARTAVPASTVHHYLRVGLIPPPNRSASNRFSYDERHVLALRLVRVLRDKQGLSLDEIGDRLPELLARPDIAAQLAEADPEGEVDVERRLVDAAIDAFQTRSYAEVTVADVADAAAVAKGSVYRYFSSKEELFTAAVERVLSETAASFAETAPRLGGGPGLATSPEQAALEFARLVAGAMPMLLELGARAAKGHPESERLARRVLCTLASAAGGPLTDGANSGADPIPAGLEVIREAFSVVLTWAVGTDWPPDDYPTPARVPPQPRRGLRRRRRND